LAASAEAPCTIVCTRLDGGRIDLLFASAGISHDLDETIDEVTTEKFIRVMVTHTLSPMRVTQALAGAAQRQDWLDVVPRPVFDRPLELAYIIPD
jgi:NAD(P)-dependent dehydrogenase (short-subunit alcohol dehydrogenase family)